MSAAAEHISVRGPLERVDGKFVLRIPLALGGDRLAKYAGTAGRIEGDVLRIDIPARLQAELEWKEGEIVCVETEGGLLSIEPWDGSE